LEKQRDFPGAMEGYTLCLNQCSSLALEQARDMTINDVEKSHRSIFLKEIRGEVMIRIAMLKKEMGALDQAMHLCNTIAQEFEDSIRANALCLKGLLHEMKAEFPTSEVVYRSVLNIKPDHCVALERLGRVYLRYRETIPAAVQCFFKAVEINPTNHVAWYLLGRCYMATSQYSDACEAYNRSINFNPNDPHTWCSLAVLYYAFGQYREALGMLARALKLNPTMADAWYNVGALYDMCDQPEDAQMAYQKAKEHGVHERFAKAGLGLNPLAFTSAGAQKSATSPTPAGVQASSSYLAPQQQSSQPPPSMTTSSTNPPPPQYNIGAVNMQGQQYSQQLQPQHYMQGSMFAQHQQIPPPTNSLGLSDLLNSSSQM
jgi:tetratricopeptide (TPR) repeat protein